MHVASSCSHTSSMAKVPLGVVITGMVSAPLSVATRPTMVCLVAAVRGQRCLAAAWLVAAVSSMRMVQHLPIPISPIW